MLQVERGARVHARPLRERPAGIDACHAFPGIHGFAVALQPRERRARIEQRARVRRIELQGATECLERFGIALIVE